MFVLSLWLPSVNKANTNNAQASEDNTKAVKNFTPAVVITLFTLLFSMMVYYVCMLYGPYLINEIGGSPAEAGTGIVILTLTGAVSALFFGKINLNSNLIYSLSFALVALGYLVLNKSMTVEWVYLGIAIAGFGIGLFLPNSTSKLMVISPKKGIPTVMSLMVVCIFGGNALGGTVAQVIRNFSNTPTTFLATAVACAIVSILYLIFRNK